MDGKARPDAYGRAGGTNSLGRSIPDFSRRSLLAPSALGLIATGQRAANAKDAQGQLTLAVHFSLAPTWFDPAAGESAFGLIRGHAYSAPYEDVTIKQT